MSDIRSLLDSASYRPTEGPDLDRVARDSHRRTLTARVVKASAGLVAAVVVTVLGAGLVSTSPDVSVDPAAGPRTVTLASLPEVDPATGPPTPPALPVITDGHSHGHPWVLRAFATPDGVPVLVLEHAGGWSGGSAPPLSGQDIIFGSRGPGSDGGAWFAVGRVTPQATSVRVELVNGALIDAPVFTVHVDRPELTFGVYVVATDSEPVSVAAISGDGTVLGTDSR